MGQVPVQGATGSTRYIIGIYRYLQASTGIYKRKKDSKGGTTKTNTSLLLAGAKRRKIEFWKKKRKMKRKNKKGKKEKGKSQKGKRKTTKVDLTQGACTEYSRLLVIGNSDA